MLLQLSTAEGAKIKENLTIELTSGAAGADLKQAGDGS